MRSRARSWRRRSFRSASSPRRWARRSSSCSCCGDAGRSAFRRMLEARNAGVRIGTRKLLDDVSLQVNAGETVAIVGENGAGKSTLLKLAGGRPAARGRARRTAACTSRAGRFRLVAGRARALARRAAATPGACLRLHRARGRRVRTLPGVHALARSARPADRRRGARSGRRVCTWPTARSTRCRAASRRACISRQRFAQLWETRLSAPPLPAPRRAYGRARPRAPACAAGDVACVCGAAQPRGARDPARPQPRGDLLPIASSCSMRAACLRRARRRTCCSRAIIAEGFGVAAQVLQHPLTEGILIATAAPMRLPNALTRSSHEATAAFGALAFLLRGRDRLPRRRASTPGCASCDARLARGHPGRGPRQRRPARAARGGIAQARRVGRAARDRVRAVRPADAGARSMRAQGAPARRRLSRGAGQGRAELALGVLQAVRGARARVRPSRSSRPISRAPTQ